MESLTLQCELSPEEAEDEAQTIRDVLEAKFGLSFEVCSVADDEDDDDDDDYDDDYDDDDAKCNHNIHWETVARTKGTAIYVDAASDGTVCLHIEYQNDYALFIRDQGLSQDNEVASDLDAL